MMAANQGAYEAHGVAIGLNIQLPHEQHSNPYQTHSLMYEHFAPRKMAFVAHSAAFVVYPGGFGTLDELFEVSHEDFHLSDGLLTCGSMIRSHWSVKRNNWRNVTEIVMTDSVYADHMCTNHMCANHKERRRRPSGGCSPRGRRLGKEHPQPPAVSVLGCGGGQGQALRAGRARP